MGDYYATPAKTNQWRVLLALSIILVAVTAGLYLWWDISFYWAVVLGIAGTILVRFVVEFISALVQTTRSMVAVWKTVAGETWRVGSSPALSANACVAE